MLVSNLLTYGTMAVEVSLALLVWNRALRPWVIGAGLLVHLGIELTIRVGFFTPALLVLYLAWLPPDWPHRHLPALRGRLVGRSLRVRGAAVERAA